MKNSIGIGDLARQTGMATSAVRYYEKFGLLPEAVRNENGYRVYNQSDVEHLDFIQMGTSLSTDDYAPLVMAYYEGEAMFFVHTEASDEGVATMLTEMMNGPLVPELADAPDSMLADMYAFTNGIEGHGPFGFQPDIFDSVWERGWEFNLTGAL